MRILAAASVVLLTAGPAYGGAGDWSACPYSSVRLVVAEEAVGGRDTLRVGVQIRLEPGWETYWRTPGDAGVPPVFDWSPSNNVGAVRLEWPLPERLEQSGIVTYGYHDEVVFPGIVTVEDGDSAVRLSLRLNYAVCRDVCIPVETTAVLDIPSAGGVANPAFGKLIERFAATVPRAPERGGITVERVNLREGREESLEILARAGIPMTAPWVIVEGPPGLSFQQVGTRLLGGGRRALIRALVKSAGRAPTGLANADVTVTLIDDGVAVERTLPAEPAD